MKRTLISIIEITCNSKERYNAKELFTQVAQFNRSITGISGMGVTLSLFLIEFLPLLYKFRRFSSLPLETRVTVIQKFESSRFFFLRLAVMLIKTQIMLVLYSMETKEKAIGYASGYRK